jgi:NDP-sugar pyrophosphorylase family protein
MQAVILAAGRGTRMGALTEHVPKPMLLLNGRPVLEYIIDSLPPTVDDVIIVVGYLGEVIRTHFGEQYAEKKISYAEQASMNGTAGALWEVKDLLRDAFLVMNGDDVCLKADVAACAASADWAMLVHHVDEIGSTSLVVTDDRDCVVDILEKESHRGGPGLANTANFFLLDTRIFAYPLVLRPGSDTEYGLPQTIVQAARDIPIHTVAAHAIIRLTEPQDIQKAEQLLAAQ